MMSHCHCHMMTTTIYPTTLLTINLQLNNNIALYKEMQKTLAYNEQCKTKNTHVTYKCSLQN